jgi:hypothetical protein
MKMAVMKLGNTPSPVAWSPLLASFPPLTLILATSSSNSLPYLAAAAFLVIGIDRMIGLMWQPTEAEAINRQTPRAKGAPNRARSGLFRPVGPVQPRFLPGCFSRDSLFVCTCMWAFDVVSFTVKA